MSPSDIGRDLLSKFKKITDTNYEIYKEDKGIQISKIKNKVNTKENKKIETDWIISTSGTTKEPKLVKHKLSSLVKTTKMDLSNNKKFIWGLSYDLYRFAGLQVLFQSLCSGSTLVIPKNISDMIEVIKIFRKQKINSLSATATYWRKFLMQKHSGRYQF